MGKLIKRAIETRLETPKRTFRELAASFRRFNADVTLEDLWTELCGHNG